MDRFIIALTALFLVIGALDKAFFHDRFGFGPEFQKGLDTMGPLTLAMVGIMCAAPAMGEILAPACAPFFEAVGTDPSMIAGILFGVDAGGLPLAQTLAHTKEAAHLFGIGLSSTLACILLFPLPFSLSVCAEDSRPFIAKGIACALIASPLSLFGVAAADGIAFKTVFQLGFPAFAVALLLAGALVFRRDATIRVFLRLGQWVMSAYAILLAICAVENFFDITIIPGMAPIAPQLSIVGEIGIMLAGAYPMVHFVKTYFGQALRFVAGLMRIDSSAALGMLVSFANPLPMYAMLDGMTNRSKVLCSAFSGPILCALGDHLGFMAAYYPEGIVPLVTGKVVAAFSALGIAVIYEKLAPSE